MGRTGVVLEGVKIEFSKNFTDIISDGTSKGVCLLYTSDAADE